jgi:threonylcarbamoyladenosine tRNA methylthiotransferase MtaB
MYVINTCSVTENADKQFASGQESNEAQQKLCSRCGLLCAVKPEELAAVDGVDLVGSYREI